MTSRQQRKLWHHVETIENFWESLEQIDAPERDQPGVMDRVMRLLGLKEPANA